MARKFEEPNIRKNDPLKVALVIDDAGKHEVRQLMAKYTKAKGFIYLDCGKAQYTFVGRLDGIEGIVGFCALTSYGHSDMYGVAIMTDPELGNQGIASTLVDRAITFAYAQPELTGLFAHVLEGSVSNSIIERYGFRAFSRRKDHLTYHLDTTDRNPLETYTTLEGINSTLPDILSALGISKDDIPFCLNRINWCDTVLTASAQFGERYNLTPEIAERILGRFYPNTAVFPNVPPQDNDHLFDIGAIVRCVQPDILGPQGRLALPEQKLFYGCSEKVSTVAVLRPHEEEGMLTVSLYEKRPYDK